MNFPYIMDLTNTDFKKFFTDKTKAIYVETPIAIWKIHHSPYRPKIVVDHLPGKKGKWHNQGGYTVYELDKPFKALQYIIEHDWEYKNVKHGEKMIISLEENPYKDLVKWDDILNRPEGYYYFSSPNLLKDNTYLTNNEFNENIMLKIRANGNSETTYDTYCFPELNDRGIHDYLKGTTDLKAYIRDLQVIWYNNEYLIKFLDYLSELERGSNQENFLEKIEIGVMYVTDKVKVQKRIFSTSEIEYLFNVHKKVQEVFQVEEYTNQLWNIAYTKMQNERLNDMGIRMSELDSEQSANLRKEVREIVVAIFERLRANMNNEVHIDIDLVPSFLSDITTSIVRISTEERRKVIGILKQYIEEYS